MGVQNGGGTSYLDRELKVFGRGCEAHPLGEGARLRPAPKSAS